MKYSTFMAFFCLVLTACGSNTFNQNDLSPELYRGYWAMTPVNDTYRVLKFSEKGIVKVYDYECNGRENYRLNETETYRLNKTKQTNRFHLLDNKGKTFARFEILRLNTRQLLAQQTFLDKNIVPNSYQLRYQHQIGAKPICNL